MYSLVTRHFCFLFLEQKSTKIQKAAAQHGQPLLVSVELRSHLLEALNRLFVTNYFDGVGLGLSAGYEVELGDAAEVLELQSGRPAHIDVLNLLSVELVGGVCAFAIEFHTETSEVAQIDLVACQELFLEASDCVSQNALYGALGEGRIVVGDVLAESVQIEALVNLSRSVGFGGVSLLRFLRARFARHDCDTVIDHKAKCFCWS